MQTIERGDMHHTPTLPIHWIGSCAFIWYLKFRKQTKAIILGQHTIYWIKCFFCKGKFWRRAGGNQWFCSVQHLGQVLGGLQNPGLSIRTIKMRTISLWTLWTELSDESLGRTSRVSSICWRILEGLAQADIRNESAGLCCYPGVLFNSVIWRKWTAYVGW